MLRNNTQVADLTQNEINSSSCVQQLRKLAGITQQHYLNYCLIEWMTTVHEESVLVAVS